MNSPNLDSEESCIQETIAQFYSFFGRMVQLKNEIDQLFDLDPLTKNRILYQLEEIESEYILCVCVCVCVRVCYQCKWGDGGVVE